jgi:hypothetical protein
LIASFSPWFLMRNQLATYLLPEDELRLSKVLREVAPSIFFIDGDDAGSRHVNLHTDLNECESGFAYIWDSGDSDSDVAVERWKQQIATKTEEIALCQFLRSRMTGEELVNGAKVDLLLSGRVAMMGRGSDQQQHLKAIVYKAVSRISTPDIFPVSPTTREILGPKQLGARGGHHAIEWCNDTCHLLRHVGTKLLYALPKT